MYEAELVSDSPVRRLQLRAVSRSVRQLSPTSRGTVTLSDRSKYGTSVNGQRLEGDCSVTDGDVITFGLQWNTWT